MLAKQELCAADVQRMKYKADEQRKILEKLHERRDTLDENIWETEMNYARRYEQVYLKFTDNNHWREIYIGVNIEVPSPYSMRFPITFYPEQKLQNSQGLTP